MDTKNKYRLLLKGEVFILHLALFLIFSFTQAIANNQKIPSDMILIPSGSYKPLYLGDKKSGKLKEPKSIPVTSFFMDRFPVTLGDYLTFVQSNPQWMRSRVKQIRADRTYLSNWKDDATLPLGHELKAPVTFVSWFAARAYCLAQNKRLPNLDEWEYAASLFSKEADYKKKILKWYADPSTEIIPNVGSTFPNRYGIYDLHGLIWEWVEDFNSNLVTGESRGDSSLERGEFCGSSGLGAGDFEDYAAFMRFGFRSSLRGNFTLKNLGFRCARSTNEKGPIK